MVMPLMLKDGALSALSKDALKNRSFERCTIICLTDHDCITIGGPILEVCLSLLPEDQLPMVFNTNSNIE